MNLYRSDVLGALEAIKGAAAEKPLVPILTHVLFKDDAVLAYDSELGIRAKLKSPVPDAFNIKLAPFMALLKALEDEDLTIEVVKTSIKIKCGGHRSEFQQLSEEFPRPAVKVKPEDWKEVPAGFKEGVERALAAASDNEANMALASVCVSGDSVLGCDGKRVIRCRVKGLNAGEMLLSKKACRELIKLGNPKRLAVKESMALFDYHNIMLLLRLREFKDFPTGQIEKLLKDKKATRAIPDGFAAALTRLKLFSDAKENPCVELHNDGLGFTLKANGPMGSGEEMLDKWEAPFKAKGINPAYCIPFLPYAECVDFGTEATDPIYMTGETAGFEGLIMPQVLRYD